MNVPTELMANTNTNTQMVQTNTTNKNTNTQTQIPVHKWYKCISRTNKATPYPESNNSEGMLMHEGQLMLFSSNTECGRQSMTSTLDTFSSFSISYRSCADTKGTSPLFATFGFVSGSMKGVPSKTQKWKVNLR